MGGRGFRADIQALRGWAVLAVIIQHVDSGLIHAGYLGVDVFFVISGFLMTGLITRSLERGDFRFGDFWFRRARRLLPAAYVTFAVTTEVAWLLLNTLEWQDFLRQLAGAVTFTANLALEAQTGYFEGSAELKPLLHVWSLSIEEQYYMALPALLVLLPRRFWAPGMVVLSLLSLGLYVQWTATRPDAAFYQLPARAWELGIGSMAALWQQRLLRVQPQLRKLALPALLLVLLVPMVDFGMGPVGMRMVVCLATVMIMVAAHPRIDGAPITHGVARIGDASYSLYLVHWPIFAFINNVHASDPSLGHPGPGILLAGVVASLVLGFALHRLVEEPFRHHEPRRRTTWAGAALAASLLLVLAPLSMAQRAPQAGTEAAAVDFQLLRRDNVGFGEQCDGYAAFEPLAECSSGPAPDVMVWGDSFAMHLVAGIADTLAPKHAVIQATKSACSPLPGMAQITGVYTREFAERCIRFNASVLDYLARTPAIHTVVLSSPLYPYFDPQRRLLVERDGGAGP